MIQADASGSFREKSNWFLFPLSTDWIKSLYLTRSCQKDNFLERALSERRLSVCWHSVNSAEVISVLRRFASHWSAFKVAVVGIHCRHVWAASSPQAIRVDSFSEVVCSYCVITEWGCKKFRKFADKSLIFTFLTRAAGHSGSSVRVEVDVSNRISNSQRNSVSMNDFNVIGITSVQTIYWTSRIEKRACWIKSCGDKKSEIKESVSKPLQF